MVPVQTEPGAGARLHHPSVLRPAQRGEAQVLGQIPAGRAGDDRERRHQEQRARRKSQEHGLARLNIDHPQDRAEHETHEQIDPGPQQAADRLRCAQLGREALADATITLEGAGAGVPARSVASNIWSSLPSIGARPTYSTRTWVVPFR